MVLFIYHVKIPKITKLIYLKSLMKTSIHFIIQFFLIGNFNSHTVIMNDVFNYDDYCIKLFGQFADDEMNIGTHCAVTVMLQSNRNKNSAND